MPKKELIIGIDTSCYTTSMAAVTIDDYLVGDHRCTLHVPMGGRGLQQSQGVFQHIQNMADVFMHLQPLLKNYSIAAVAASTRPRPVDDSYMPVFTVGESQGRVLAAGLGVPFWCTSHQEGHLFAGLWSAKASLPTSFLAVHVSGGTSELLHVISHPEQACLESKILGATRDLHAGQFVDRVGVSMGLPFPAGPHLEELAEKVQGEEVYLPSSVDGYDFSFSGSETYAHRLLNEGYAPANIARGVENCIAKTLEKIIRRAISATGIRQVLLVGGVMANKHIRARLRRRLEHPAVKGELFFAEPVLSTDNAVGVALSGALAWRQGLIP